MSMRGRRRGLTQKLLSMVLVLFMLSSGVIPTNIGIAQATESLSLFRQGEGYQQGLYDQMAEQPTVFNWNRQSRFAGPETNELQWQFSINGEYNSQLTPVIGSDGTVYIGGDKMYALDSKGTEKWSYQPGAYVQSNATLGQNGTIYFGADKLYALDSTGVKLWEYPVNISLGTSPAIGSDGTIYVTSLDGNLYAISTIGELKWKYTTALNIFSSPAIAADGTIYFSSADKNLYAINPDGTLKWSFLTGEAVQSSPILGADGTIYFGSNDHLFYALNPDGTKKWDFPTGGTIQSSAAIDSRGVIYFYSDDWNLYAVKPDGSELWEYRKWTGGSTKTSPIIDSAGTVYSTQNYTLFTVDSTGKGKWDYGLNYWNSSPSIGSEGTVYVVSDGILYAIGNNVKPYAPSQLNATGQSSTEIDLTWEASAKATSYNIYRSKSSNGIYTKIGTSTETNFKDTSLSPLTTYWYKVSGVNDFGESPLSAARSGMTLDPNIPLGLSIQQVKTNQVDLSWDPVSEATAYKVYRKQNYYDSYTPVGTTSDPQFSDINVSAYNSYWYKVAAVTGMGESALSTEATIYTVDLPDFSIKAVSLSPETVSLGQTVTVEVQASGNIMDFQYADVGLTLGAESKTLRLTYDSARQAYLGEYVVNQTDLGDSQSAVLAVSSVKAVSTRYNPVLFQSGLDFLSPQVTVTDQGINISLEADSTIIPPNSSSTTISAFITNDKGEPIPNAAVILYYYTMDKEDAWYTLAPSQTDQNGVAAVPFTPPTLGETYCFIAEVGGVTSGETLQIQSEVPTPTTVKISTTQTTIDADGAYDLPLFVEVDDQYGNPMADQEVELALNGLGSLSTLYTRTTGFKEESGYSYVSYHVPNQTGEAQITAKVGELVSDPLILNLVSPSAAAFRWNQSEVSIEADGSTIQEISGIVYDHNHVPIPGQIVSLSLLGSGTLKSTRTVSQDQYHSGDGLVWASIIAPSQIGEGILQAKVGDVESDPLPIHFVEPVPRTIYWQGQDVDNTLKIYADGKSTQVLQVIVSDKPSPWWDEGRLAGQEVKFSLTGPGTLNQETAFTDSNGVAQIVLSSPLMAGEASLVASVGDLKTLPLLIDFIPTDSSATSAIRSISLSPDSATVGQSVTIKIELDHMIIGTSGIDVDVQIGSQTRRPIWCRYDTESSSYIGKYIVNKADLMDQETGVLSIPVIQFNEGNEWRDYFNNQDFVSPTVTVNNADLSIELTSDKEVLTSNGRSKANVRVTVKDQNGSPLPQANVRLDIFLENQPDWYDIQEILTDETGKAMVEFNSPYTPGNIHITADVGGVKSAEDLIIPCEDPVPTSLRVYSDRSTYDADGVYLIPLRIEALDQSGSPLQGTNVELTSTGAGSLSTNGVWVWSDWRGDPIYNSPEVYYTVPSIPGTAEIIAKVGELQSEPLKLTFETPQVSGIKWLQNEVSLSIGELAQSPIQAHVFDRNKQGLSNQRVTFELQGAGTLNQSQGVSQSNLYGGQGIVETGIIAPNEPGEAILIAKVGNVQSEPLTIHYVEAIPASITWNFPENYIVLNADGTSSIDLQTLVLDQTQAEWGSFGRVGEVVRFTLEGPGSLSQEVAGTDVQGIAKVTLIAPNIPGSATLTASIGDLTTPPVRIDFVEYQVGELKLNIGEISMDEENVPILDADGSGKIPIEAVITDTTGRPMANQIIQFSNSASLPFDATTGMTDEEGRVLVHLIAPSTPAGVTVQANCGDLVTSRLAYFETPRPGSVSWGIDDQVLGEDNQVINAQGTMEADAIGQGRVYVIVKDKNGLPLSGIRVHFRLEGGGSLDASEAITDSEGKAEVRLTAPYQLGTAQIFAQISELENPEVANSLVWDLKYVNPTPGEILITASNLALRADGQETVDLTVQVKDHHGVPLANQEVLLWQNGPGTLDRIQLMTGADGKGNAQLTAASSPGYAWIIASVDNIRSEPLKVEYLNETSKVQIMTTVLPTAYQGTEYQVSLDASGGTAPYKWSASGLPEGLTLDSTTGIIQGQPSIVGISTIELTASDSVNHTVVAELLLNVLQKSVPQYTAQFSLRFEENSLDQNVGLAIGLSSIVDLQGQVATDRRVAGYKLEIDYDPESVQILDVINQSNLGHFYTNLSQPGKVIILDAGDGITTALERLAFVRLLLKGSATTPTPIAVKFLELSDQKIEEINPPQPQIIMFQRGKVVSFPDGTAPKITDAIAGLQYLAGILKTEGDSNRVNLVSLASISQNEIQDQKLQADLKDVIALIQYLVDLRDDNFDLK